MSRKFKPFLLFSAVLLWATWASASVAIIQSKGCNATACTFNFPITSGNAILVAGATAGNSSNFTPTDNFSDIYVQDDRAGANFGANGTWLTLYRASAITGGITTVSTSATGAVRTLTILEVAGLDPSPVDVKNQAGNTFTGGSCNSAVTTTNANDLVLNFCIDNSGSTNIGQLKALGSASSQRPAGIQAGWSRKTPGQLERSHRAGIPVLLAETMRTLRLRIRRAAP